MNFKYFIVLLLCCGLATMGTAQCPTTDITFTSQAAIDNFSANYPGCTMIPAGVDVTIGDPSLGDITNLDGFSQITSIAGNLYIYYNNFLTNIDGLSQITFIGGYLEVFANNALTNVDGLSQITSVGGYLKISSNNALTSIDGLSQITSVGGYLLITVNDITNVDGLSQITSVGGHLEILYNDHLTNLDGLSQIISIGEHIRIQGNSALVNVDGLSQLTSVAERLDISYNDALTNVDGLNQISSVGGYLKIAGNPQLDQCCALCPLLVADAANPTVIDGIIDITDNLTSCNSPSEINACSPCGLVATSTPEYAPTQLSIYPNPAKNILHFQYGSSGNELVNFTIENHLGQQIIQSQTYTNQPLQVDISSYPAGLYILNVLQGNQSINRLFSVSR